MEKYYISNLRSKQIELIKTMDFTEDDPAAFRKSKLMKTERISCAMPMFGENMRISISIVMSDRETMTGVLDSLFTRITEEEYERVKEGTKKLISDSVNEFKKLLPNIE